MPVINTKVLVTPLSKLDKKYEEAKSRALRVNVLTIPNSKNSKKYLFKQDPTTTDPRVTIPVPISTGGKNSKKRSTYRKKSTRRRSQQKRRYTRYKRYSRRQ